MLSQNSHGFDELIKEVKNPNPKFQFGSQILIIKLQQNQSYNNKIGFIIGDYNPEKDRYPIKIINTDDIVWLKAHNLQLLAQTVEGIELEKYELHESSNDESMRDNSSDDDDSSSSSDSNSNNSVIQ